MIWMWDALYGGLEPQPWPYNIVRAWPYIIFPKIQPHLYKHNSVRVHQYAHPQLIKVLKHFVYKWYECGMQSMGVCNLNHDITTLLGLSHALNFQKSPPQLQGYGALICQFTAFHCDITLCIQMKWIWDTVNGGWQPQPWHLNIVYPPAHVLWHKGAPICPSISRC